jgi:hypothetical protein
LAVNGKALKCLNLQKKQMNLELTGRLTQLMDEVSGTGRNGNWVKREFVVETTDDQYPRKICFSLWGDKTEALKSLEPGAMLKVHFNLESREYNNRWYTDARAWRLEPLEQGAGATETEASGGAPAHTEADMPESKDDLPF